MSRINLRLSESLKGRIEEAACQAGLSVNAWLVRAAAAAVAGGPQGGGPDRSYGPRAPSRGQRYSGWIR